MVLIFIIKISFAGDWIDWLVIGICLILISIGLAGSPTTQIKGNRYVNDERLRNSNRIEQSEFDRKHAKNVKKSQKRKQKIAKRKARKKRK
ncbi:hypothetical protein RJG79_09120 [Mycoplasmatota bacterium WC44]